MDGGMFNGIGSVITAGIVCFFLVIGLLGYIVVDWLWFSNTQKSHKLVVPEVRIKTETINGVMESDTTYIYKF